MSETRLRAQIAERSLGRCEIVGCSRRAESVHHRIKRSHGGLWTLDNCLHVCGSGTTGCHGRIEHEPLLALTLGYGLQTGEDPAVVPAYLNLAGTWISWWILGEQSVWVDRHPPDRLLWDRAA